MQYETAIPPSMHAIPKEYKHFRFIDVFAGIGGFRFGFEPKGGTCVWSCEINPHSRKTYSHNHDEKEEDIFPDVRNAEARDIPDHDILIAGFACFAKDTMVLSEHGFTPIQNIRPGTMVLTHRGRWRPVLDVMKRPNAPTTTLHAQGVPGVVTTDDHPFYARASTTAYSRSTKTVNRTFASPAWTEVKHIGTGHHLAQVLPPTNTDPNDPSFWWLIGRYLATGYRTDPPQRSTGIVIIFGTPKDPIPAQQPHHRC